MSDSIINYENMKIVNSRDESFPDICNQSQRTESGNVFVFTFTLGNIQK